MFWKTFKQFFSNEGLNINNIVITEKKNTFNNDEKLTSTNDCFKNTTRSVWSLYRTKTVN